MRDGVSVWEAKSIYWLARLAHDNQPAASQILDMPFLNTHEPEDAVTLMALWHSGRYGDLAHFLAQPVFQGGIKDADSPMVAFGALLITNGEDPKTLERVLVPGYADVETLSRGTELSPHMKVSIIRTGTKGQRWVADAILDIVELAESLMGLPLPVGHVVMMVSNENPCDCTWGFAFDARLEWEQGKETPEGDRLQGHIAHELFHNYIQRAEWWLYDGTAEAFKYIYGAHHGVDPQAYKATRGGCEAHDLQMLTDQALSPGEPGFGCVYYLGGELFRELFNNLGFEEYGARLNELRRISSGGQWLGIDQVRQVFHNQSDIVEKHWSGKFNAPENLPWDIGMADSSHNLIQWDQYPTYDGEFVTFSGALLGNAVLSSGTIAEANNDGYGNFHIYSVNGSKFTGNISPPGQNRPRRDPGDTNALEYRLEGRTFNVRFRFPQKLGDPSGYIVDVWGFQDESRTPVIWDARDRLGYARIRVE